MQEMSRRAKEAPTLPKATAAFECLGIRGRRNVSLRPQSRGSPLKQLLIQAQRRNERTKSPRVRLLYFLSLPDWLAFVRDQPIPLLLFSPLRSQCSFPIFLFFF